MKVETGLSTYPLDKDEASSPTADFREVAQTWHQSLRRATLRRWQEKAGAAWEGWSFLLWKWMVCDPDEEREAPPALDDAAGPAGLLRPSALNHAYWGRWIAPFPEGPKPHVLLRTPASFTPTDRNRDALRRFVHELAAPAGFPVEWEARGLWEREDVVQLCAEHGVRPLLDPWLEMEDPVAPRIPMTFVVERGRSGRMRLSEDDLWDLMELVEAQRADVRLVFRGQHKHAHLSLWQRLVAAEGWIQGQPPERTDDFEDDDDLEDDDEDFEDDDEDFEDDDEDFEDDDDLQDDDEDFEDGDDAPTPPGRRKG